MDRASRSRLASRVSAGQCWLVGPPGLEPGTYGLRVGKSHPRAF
jgi:hypothetical protein